MYRVSSDCVILAYNGRSAAGSSVEYLVEEDVFPVAAFCSKVFEVAILIDAVFLTQLLPELAPH